MIQNQADSLITKSQLRPTSLKDVHQFLGGIGWYHWYLVILFGTSAIPGGIETMILLYTEAEPDFYCSVPELESSFTPAEIKNMTSPYFFEPICQTIAYDGCTQYNLSLPRSQQMDNLIECETHKYVFDQTIYQDTIVTEFNLVCQADKIFLRSLATSASFAGQLTSCFTGYLIDNFGRKNVVIWATLLGGCSFFACSCVSGILGYILLRFIGQVCSYGCYNAGFTYSLEIVPEKYRAWASFSGPVFWIVGYWILNSVAYYVKSWRLLNAIMAIIPMFLVPLYLVAPESATYLLSKNQVAESQAVLTEIANKNGLKVDSKRLSSMLQDLSKDKQLQSQTSTEITPKSTFISLFQHGPKMTLLTIKLVIIWGTVAVLYGGLALDASFLPGSLYQTIFLYGIIDNLANFIFPLAMSKKFLGRRKTLFFSLILAGIFCSLISVLSHVIPCEHQVQLGEISAQTRNFLRSLVLVSGLIGRGLIAGVFCLVYTYTGELYPTAIRANAVSMGMFGAGIFCTLGIPAIMLSKSLYVGMPGLIFGLTSVMAAFIGLSLPETLGVETLNTIEDAKRLYSKR